MRIRVVMSVVVLSALLSGCADGSSTPSPTAEPSTSSTGSPIPSSEPSAEPIVEPLTIPGCETMVPLAFAKAQFSESTEFFGELTAAEYSFRIEVAGAPEALTSAEVFRGCNWAVPNSDGSFSLAVASVTADTRAAVQAGLAAAGFTSVTMGTVSGFDTEFDGAVSVVGATYLFTGDVMIVCQGTGIALTGAIAGSALDAVRVANPTLSL
ncbi:hypothetical protein [Microcella sp.]|uniref:hypothetical protein n=1 Tax=Microcella sp. TaxID=1913979 RepID=UPI003F702240